VDIRLDEIILLEKREGHLLVEGKADGTEIKFRLNTQDVDNLWFSIQRSQRRENLRVLKEARIERMKRGRLC
jgi:hypothetical protein